MTVAPEQNLGLEIAVFFESEGGFSYAFVAKINMIKSLINVKKIVLRHKPIPILGAGLLAFTLIFICVRLLGSRKEQ